jgi:arylsulfatase A-like enzyme
MLPTALFNLSYAIFWVGLFSVLYKIRSLLRWTVVGLFHLITVLVVIVASCAYQYSQETGGSALDYDALVEWIPKFKDIRPLLFGDVPPLAKVVVAAAIFYAVFGPWLITHTLKQWRGWPRRSPAETAHENSFLIPLVLCLLGIGFGSLSVLITTTNQVARDPFVNVVATGVNGASTEDNWDSKPATGHPAAHTSLVQTPKTDKRNVVLIHLESTRAQSTTPYNENLKTMPFLDELAKNSLLAEQAHVVLPRTSKASVAVNCGVEPPLYSGPEFGPSGIPDRCLADLLNEQGYRTAFFQSTNNTIDNFGDVVKNFGYDQDYPVDSLDTSGFQRTNTFGYEDDIMLGPSEQWLKSYGDKPFMAEYLTGTGHYNYECVPNRYGTQNFSNDDQLNRYLNCLHYLDSFLNNLFDQYKTLGLYDKTIFVIFGDHGEGFGEHGRFMHGDTIYEEGLRVPLIIHAPGWFKGGQREEGLSSQIDILPTVLEMLGYMVKNGEYPGYSLLHPVPDDRTLMFSCISSFKCLASIKGEEKYVYNYGNQPDEVFNLSKDPLEKNNLASLFSKEELDKRREELLAWRSKVDTEYGDTLTNGTLYSEE